MKNHFSTVSKFAAAAICALSLGSCSRAEYAMLPKGASYHGVARAATPVPAPAPVVAAPNPVAPTTAMPAEAVALSTSAATPVARERVSIEKAAKTAAAATTIATTTAAKPTLVQRLALNKVTRKMDKLMQKAGSVRSHDNTASTARGGISGNLRTGLILLLVGLLVGIFNGLIGTIIALIGVIFIVLWLLDSL